MLHRFELFGDGEKFGDGIPVASGDGDFHAAVDGGPGQIGLANAVRKIDVEFARSEVHFFRAGVNGAKFGASFGSGIASQETDEEFARMNVAALGERVSSDDVAELGGCAVNDAGAEAEFAFNGFLDAFGKSREVALASAENDVAAIDVGLATGEFERFVKSTQRVHFDLIATGDVDAAQQGDDGGHGPKYTARIAHLTSRA